MGDAHAAQGEGEITGIAIEIEADVRLQIHVQSQEEAQYGRFPILEYGGLVGVVVGQMGVSLTDNIRAGYVDLVDRLVRYHGYSKEGAYMLVGQVGHVEVGNLITPFFSCWVSIPHEYLT
jgi:acetamidase/formamidase